MKKLIVLTLIILMFCISCQQSEEDSLDVNISTYAQQLIACKNPYIGDASANGKLLELLNITQEFGSYSVELQTDESPYWMRLNFDGPVSNSNEFDLKMFDKASMLLALIDNANEVQWSYPYIEEGKETFNIVYVTQKQATDTVGKNIKSFAKSESGIQELLNQLNE